MIKIYGKGDTVSDSEYWDGRDTYKEIEIFINDGKKIEPTLRDALSNNMDMFSIIEGLGNSVFKTNGVIKNSFYSEFNISTDDFIPITIGSITKYYARLTPGIAKNNVIYINKPATELAKRELEEILKIRRDENDEFVDIKYDIINDKFSAKISKVINGRIEILNFSEYNTGVELLFAIFQTSSLTDFFVNTIGDDFTKIDLEKTVKIDSTGTYYWCLKDDGDIDLLTSVSGVKLCSFSVSDLSNGIDTIDNSHDISSLASEGESFPSSPIFAQEFWKTDTSKWYKYNGSSWVEI